LLIIGLAVGPSATAALYASGLVSFSTTVLLVCSCFFSLLLGTFLIITGISGLVDSPSASRGGRFSNWLTALRFIICDPSSRRVRFGSSITYGVFLAILSGILVIQPGQSFSKLYETTTPSFTFAVCCAPLGGMPQLVVYLLDNVGLVLTPLGVMLLLIVSWLVGTNVSGAVSAVRARSARKDNALISTMGSFLGIFSVCPSCAQGLLSAILGGSGVLFVTLLSSYQGFFIGASIPLLVISLLWTAKAISRISVEGCSLPANLS
jgi:hypothetical protein